MIRTFVFSVVLLSSLSAFAEPREGCAELRKTARFTVYFEKVDLEKLVQTVSDATCRSFIVGENVRGKISIVGPENGKLMLDADQFYAAFLAALDANGFTTVPEGRFFRVVEKKLARQFPIGMVAPGGDIQGTNEVVTVIHRVKNVEAESLRAVIGPFLTAGAEVVVAPPDLLIITDLGNNQRRIASLIAQLDVVRPTTEVLRLVQIKHAAADELLDKVSRLLAPKAGGKPADALVAIADDRTNRMLLSGPSALVERAQQLIEQLDIEIPGDSRARVIRLRNADAKELASTLEAMTGASSSRASPGRPPAPSGGGSTTGDVRISVNEALNALLIVSSAGDYRVLSEVIEALDRPVKQVFIETLIMEVNLQRDSKLGISMHGAGGTADVPFVIGSQPEGAPSSLSLATLATSTGLLAGVQGPVLTAISKLLGISLPTFGFAIVANQGSSDVNVMSTPHILTADNKEAEIAVGQKIPFSLGVNQSQLAAAIASGSTTASNLTALTSVSREKVELRLTVKPHIGDGDDIRLEINQQAEELAGTSSSAGPITSTRGQKTTVVARNEETLVLGGIMQDRDIDTVSKIPGLGDIPLLGNLFRTTTRTKTKVNLLVFLTPHIVNDAADFKRLVERKMAERRKVLEEFYGTQSDVERTIDFDRKPGPMAMIERNLAREMRRPVNGGKGEAGEHLFEPN